MASFQAVGFIDCIKYIPNQGGCFVFLSEFKKGFKRKNGTKVEDRYLTWKIIFKQGLVKYISEHFGNGMLVEVKGEVLPYTIEHGEVRDDGCSVIGQCINLTSYPRYTVKQEMRMIKDSQLQDGAKPDLDAYEQPDF